MHVTLFAVLARWAIRRVWRLGARRPLQLPLWLPAPPVVMLGAAAAAMAYAMLAGFNLPAQRTAWMVLVVSLAGTFGRSAGRWGIVSTTLMVMLLWDPTAVLSPGFWLSFIAVSVLMAQPNESSHSPGPGPRTPSAVASRIDRIRLQARVAWRQLGPAARSQLAITAGLAGLTVVFFQQFSVVGPLANALAIPVVSFVVTPLAMLGAVSAPAGLPHPLLAAHGIFGLLMDWLAWLAQPSWAGLAIPAPPTWAAALVVIGPLAALLLPRSRGPFRRLKGFEWRHLGWLGLLGLLAGGERGPAEGRWRLEAMDVGQGSSLLIRTRHHSLLVDTGPPLGQGLAVDRVVLPHLTARGIRRLDGLLISHGDADHASGLERVLERLRPAWARGNLKHGQPPGLDRCVDGHQWEWDGVVFTLHQLPLPAFSKLGGNLDSCGLEVRDQSGHRLVVLGDAHAPQERRLTLQAGWQPRAAQTLLVLSHHGSKTSSDPALLAALSPSLAVSQSAHHGRFRHPHPAIQARLADAGIPLLRADLLGAIRVESGLEGLSVSSQAVEEARPWETRRER